MADQEDEEMEEIEEDPAYPFLINLPRRMDQNDPRRTFLTFEEWQFLCQLQTAFVEDNNNNPEVSDYMLCQIAIHSHSVADATRLASGLQAFRERYGVQDSLEEGCRAVKEFLELLPELFLYHGFDGDKGTYVLVADLTKFDTRVLETDRQYRTIMVGEYYLLQAMNCDLATARLGPEGIFDCWDVGWTMKADFQILKDLFQQLIQFYPAAPTVRHRNVGVIFNLLFATVKKVLPRKLRDKFEFVHSSTDNGPMRQVFMVPTAQAANQRVIASLQAALQRRYENERNFHLA